MGHGSTGVRRSQVLNRVATARAIGPKTAAGIWRQSRRSASKAGRAVNLTFSTYNIRRFTDFANAPNAVCTSRPIGSFCPAWTKNYFQNFLLDQLRAPCDKGQGCDGAERSRIPRPLRMDAALTRPGGGQPRPQCSFRPLTLPQVDIAGQFSAGSASGSCGLALAGSSRGCDAGACHCCRLFYCLGLLEEWGLQKPQPASKKVDRLGAGGA